MPEQERAFDWAEPSHLGRFGIFKQGERIPCDGPRCRSGCPTAYIEPQSRNAPPPLVWEDGKTGQLYHYRCAPLVERERYQVIDRFDSYEASLAGMHGYGLSQGVHAKGHGTAHGITGEWVTVGGSYGPDPATDGGHIHTHTLLLWRRDGQQQLF